jgi:hypothetical protein
MLATAEAVTDVVLPTLLLLLLLLLLPPTAAAAAPPSWAWPVNTPAPVNRAVNSRLRP